MPSLIVVGAGPGIGASVAAALSDAGDRVGLVARSRAGLEVVAQHLPRRRVRTARADVADARALDEALDTLLDAIGLPEVVVYNAGLIRADRPGELSDADHHRAWSVNVLGAARTAARIGPAMAARGRGTLLFTAGMPVPAASHTSLSLGKAGLRALVDLLADDLEPSGVHVAEVTVGGAVEAGGRYDPDAIATAYRALLDEPYGRWRRHVAYDGPAASTPAVRPPVRTGGG
ncbi:NADP-dependent 3-hydroxy acid dehydrogenase YdfG [Mumia flava]|uniref:NADP-dependent 3-hydroxy acid dehydrogenase YdfG n=1 Tax=Mumia flava TaxID=1348852 RepID=A0A2M9B7A8_9ACTN|nr:SDR family NAD(P)-dependent oxidoreductase [Mumia flava]PJJ53818.1 NADP-dependent 3-hydroxy acid dehydrogenase YdfG [Mumia flava]